MGLDMYRQEYECSFDIGAHGSIYSSELIARMAKEKVSEDPAHPLFAAFDLGWNDHTAYWVYQYIDGRFRFLSCHQDTRQKIEHFLDLIEAEYARKPRLFLPHDAVATSVGSGTSVADVCRNLGFVHTVLKKAPLIDQLNDVRRHLSVCDARRDDCADGLRALMNYRRSWDTEKMRLSDHPIHDKHSDYADSFRYAVMSKEHISRHRLTVKRKRQGNLSISVQ